MIRRLVILQGILLAGLSLIFALPRTPPIQDSALKLELPNVLTLSGFTGGVFGAPSDEEKKILAKDTNFLRRNYYREVPVSEQEESGKYDPRLIDSLHASIVMSGKDLTNSIHALERCLTAQGFNIPQASTMQVKLRTGQSLPVRRLYCERADAKSGRVSRSIAYYWFVGHDSVTSNHIKRGLKDFSDRVLRGYDQRWAYVTITAQLDPGPVTEQGKDDKEPRTLIDRNGNPRIHRALTGEQADHLASELLFDLGPDIMKLDEIKEWPEE